MNDTIRSGDTDNVISQLLNNNFGEQLFSMHHSRVSSLANTNRFDFGTGEAFNHLPLPKDLTDDIQIDVNFLSSVANPNQFAIFKVGLDFYAVDERHMTVKKDTMFVGLKIIDEDWVFGCPDKKPDNFGFVPRNYLEFVRDIDKTSETMHSRVQSFGGN